MLYPVVVGFSFALFLPFARFGLDDSSSTTTTTTCFLWRGGSWYSCRFCGWFLFAFLDLLRFGSNCSSSDAGRRRTGRSIRRRRRRRRGGLFWNHGSQPSSFAHDWISLCLLWCLRLRCCCCCRRRIVIVVLPSVLVAIGIQHNFPVVSKRKAVRQLVIERTAAACRNFYSSTMRQNFCPTRIRPRPLRSVPNFGFHQLNVSGRGCCCG